MNIQDYINELKLHLSRLTDEDREDAISYYFEYLAEAGPEGYELAMEKLGSPAELAAGIRADQALQDFSDRNAAGGATVGKGVKAVWYAGLAAVPRTALAIFVTIIIIIVFFAVMIVLFAVAIAIIGAGVLAFIGGGWMLGGMDLASVAFYAGAGLALGGFGFLVFRFAIWSSKHMLFAIAEVFNGIRKKRGTAMDRRQPS